MTGTVPPPVIPAAAAAAAPAAPVVLAEATVVRLPERLMDVGRAVVVSGTVAGETPDGLTRVRTAAGEILVKSPTPLPADKPVTLQIAAGNPPGKAVVLAQPPAGGAAAAPQPAGGGAAAVLLSMTQAAAPALPTATAPAPPLAAGTVLPALVLAAAPKPSGLPANAALPGVAAPATPPAPPAAQPPSTTAPTAPGQPTGPAAPGQVPTPPAAGAPAAPVPAAPAGLPRAAPAPAPSGAAPAPAGAPSAAPAAPVAAAPSNAAAPTLAPALSPAPGAAPAAAGPPVAAAVAAPAAPPPAAPAMPPTGTPATAPPAPAASPTAAPAPPPSAAVPSQPPAAGPAPAPAPDGVSGPASAQPQGAAPQPQPQPRPPAAGQPPAPALPQGATVALRILSVAPPGAEAPPPPAPAAAGETVLSGTVAGVTNQGQPILATKDGMLALNTRASAPPGTRITAALAEAGGAVPAATAPAPADLVALAASGRDWPALRQVMGSLGGLDRALAQTLLGTILPQPNRKLGAALAFFLSAARGGDARGWLGAEAAGALERSGRGALLERLEREFRDAQQPPVESPAGEWRPVAMPMLDGTGLHPVRLFVRPAGEEEADAAEGRRERGSRFLIDVELSRLGPMQLDGLVRERRFDLILRSRAALDAELRGELTRVFADSLAAVGYAGGLGFQSGARSWVTLTRGGGGLGVTA